MFILINFVHLQLLSIVVMKMTKMLPIQLELNRYGYDPFIDFMKGICILLVILNHSIPSEIRSAIGFPFWGSPAVPIFLIIQVFHFYKKGIDSVKLNYIKIWKRIARPFFVVELLIFVVWLYKYYRIANSIPSIKESVYMLTGGPGSYYPWIYLQFAILLPLCRPLMRINSIYILLVILLLSQFAELLCTLITMPEWIYRLTFFRYIFLIYLGSLLATKGITLNGITMTLSVISIASIFLFTYSNIDTSPMFYNIDAWSTCHWISYIYIAFFMIIMLKKTYVCLQNNNLSGLIIRIGKYSYEIYLFQLLFFTCVSDYIINLLSLDDKKMTTIILSTLLCVIPVLLYKKIEENLKQTKIINGTQQ